ncbi:hypothetical protein B0J11DRAFT_529636 [Dendryphion nanum]|uniref:Secreted LysM effector LysM C-terminal domain-containing protein n=1 Tax=Dendryphion nanum TaxID=256645 RepID=A0A9P9DRD2_9PLEO|nr:hypothetical protein B0J11DRAFT_529636 [Dendryphion nanum]
MQLSLATVGVLLAVAQASSAWQIIVYEGVDNCARRAANRVLRGSQKRCYTFGKGMPGVSCTHYDASGAPAEGCTSPYHLAHSVRLGTGERCVFYTDDRCTRVLATSDRRNQCIGFINIPDGQSYAASFVCENA